VHLMSISIDPERTPGRLRAYARSFNACPRGSFTTGRRRESRGTAGLRRVTGAREDEPHRGNLDACRPGKPWLRIEGFVTPDSWWTTTRSCLLP